jgi:hypothetical protein
MATSRLFAATEGNHEKGIAASTRRGNWRASYVNAGRAPQSLAGLTGAIPSPMASSPPFSSTKAAVVGVPAGQRVSDDELAHAGVVDDRAMRDAEALELADDPLYSPWAE